VDKDANDVLAAVQADLDRTKEEVEELKASLNPDMGHNGGAGAVTARLRSPIRPESGPNFAAQRNDAMCH
jgi:hypothetical protein